MFHRIMAGTDPNPLPRILIVDDHPIILFGLRFVIERDGRFVICGEAGDPEVARTMTGTLRPDYVIVDLVLGGRDGIALVRDLARLSPSSRILVYSSQNEGRYAQRALRAGARGYVAKTDGLDMVLTALGIVATDRIFISDSLTNRLIEKFLDTEAEPTLEPDHGFSDRELQVLRLIGEGCTLGEVAAELGLSVKTIGTYRDRLKAKLDVERSGDLAWLARNHVVAATRHG